MRELSMEEMETINGGVNWVTLGEGICGDIGVIAGVAAAPEITIPVIAGAIAGGVGSSLLTGSAF